VLKVCAKSPQTCESFARSDPHVVACDGSCWFEVVDRGMRFCLFVIRPDCIACSYLEAGVQLSRRVRARLLVELRHETSCHECTIRGMGGYSSFWYGELTVRGERCHAPATVERMSYPVLTRSGAPLCAELDSA